ncbi:MAG TPA: cyclic nucleotide-binding domain-containing protein [Syntrophobacteria bacterium]|nr:cyclic nucleotide-binding domain-containing protein [Syntrophobacteria bacterium]
MKKYYLAVERGSIQANIYPLLGPTTIGRGPDNTIIIQDPTASRSHACVSFRDGVWLVEDLGSRNGIIASGRRIQDMPLKSGDTFQIGEISFRFLEKDLGGRAEHLAATVEVLSAAIEESSRSSRGTRPAAGSERLQQAIAEIPFFSSLGEAQLSKLAETATLHVFQSGDSIIREGDPGRSVFLILAGRVRVFTRDYRGNELDLAALGVGQFFGEMSFLTGKPRSSFVAALEGSVLIELSYAAMSNLVRENPQLKDTLVKYFRERIESTRKKREEVGMPERRQNDRVRARVAVIFSVLSGSEGSEDREVTFYNAHSRDISMSGMLLECERSVAERLGIGTELRLELKLPSPWGDVRAVGTVQRFPAAASGEQKAAVVALEFKAMPSEDIQKLKGFLHGEDHLPSVA